MLLTSVPGEMSLKICSTLILEASLPNEDVLSSLDCLNILKKFFVGYEELLVGEPGQFLGCGDCQLRRFCRERARQERQR